MKAVAVVRTSGERTESRCIDALKQEIEHVIPICVFPFIRAVEKTFEVGASFRADWLFAVDADVVFYPGSIARMIEEAELLSKDRDLFKIDFLFKDKFRGNSYGTHVYANKNSEEFRKHFSEVPYDPTVKRPESSNVVRICKALKFSKLNSKVPPVATHDFDQFYRHIYVKYFNRAVRDSKVYQKIRNGILKKLEECPSDTDFVVALRGMEDGCGKSEMKTDSSCYPDVARLLEELKLQEKQPL